MKSKPSFHIPFFCFNLLFLPLASSFSWDIWKVFQPDSNPRQNPHSERSVKRISHQAASDSHQDVLLDDATWFDVDGTPLFYGAWRAKPGATSAEPVSRSSLVKYGARVACWPSSGGIWIKHADLVDLNFLGLSRIEDTPRQFNQTAEDEFCTKLKMTGPEWWKLPATFGEREHLGKEQFTCDTLEDCFRPDIKNHYLIAWPETAMVVCYIPIVQAEERGETSLTRYYNAMDMEERCDMIRSLGGKWCRCKAECPDLKNLDWSFRDPGIGGCHDPPLLIDDMEALGVGPGSN
ncbi:hypothetical protein P153DRAFT_194207 [Dothidotthia symphoricarpi CBS 119687]|uniref:Uncharacterized protein n=1 Tax=Dothidotthia symphoricarpi CBS 119687 TaxID=1392245 RepID=A0A6A6AHB5_9PLEO|nr:uncharacterized protein P153DRAFT_194207 [Dothidotthia symphoricarpi CBS 119687]KAF2131382.1 hypothetical protein P153DRAFT_194207 [Dothidotthia symphoricarpi CBS 119687]